MSVDFETLAKRAAKEAVQETFLALGVNISTPDRIISTQRAFAFLYSTHALVDKARVHAVRVLVGLALTGVGSAVWFVVKAKAG